MSDPLIKSLGRISGPLLKDNLLRQGTDLAFETDLLYLNVNDLRIGINTDSPVYDLDVNGTTNSPTLETPNTAFIANFAVATPASSFTPTSGDTTISPLQENPTVLFNRITTDLLDINDNYIASFNGENIVFSPAGTGSIDLLANTNIAGDLYVSGNITVDGDLSTISNLVIGDQSTDTVSIVAKFGTGLRPTEDATYDLGEEGFQWRDLYGTVVSVDDDFAVGNFSISPLGNISVPSGSITIIPADPNPTVFFEEINTSDLNFNGNVISSIDGQDIVLFASGTGTIDLNGNTNTTGDLFVSNNLIVDNDLLVPENLTLGNGVDTEIIVNASMDGDLIPSADITYDVGSSSFRWSTIYVDNAYIDQTSTVANFTLSDNGNISVASGSITIKSAVDAQFEQIITSSFNIDGNVIQSVNDQNIIFDPSGTGTVDLNGNTNVSGDVGVTDNLLVNNNVNIIGDVTLGDSTTTIINAKLQNNLIPDTDIAYDIGSSNLRWKSIFSNTASVSTLLSVADFDISNQGNITNDTGSIIVDILGTNPTAFFNRIENSDLFFDGNLISSFDDADIILDTSGTGSINLLANTKLFGDLDVSGDINLDGNLSTTSNIIIGDEIVDVVIINADFTQEINPGQDLTYDLGTAQKRWSELYIDSTSVIENYNIFDTLSVNNTFVIDGVNAELKPSQTNTDLNFLPVDNNTIIERIQFNANTITNLENTPLTLSATGIGYYRFSGNNGVIVPQGDTSTRPQTPEVGDTRWNTELGFLECFNGEVYQIATGPSNIATAEFMEDAINSFALILG